VSSGNPNPKYLWIKDFENNFYLHPPFYIKLFSSFKKDIFIILNRRLVAYGGGRNCPLKNPNELLLALFKPICNFVNLFLCEFVVSKDTYLNTLSNLK